MNKCCGILGVLFGHKYKAFVVMSEPVFRSQEMPDAATIGMFSADLAATMAPAYKTSSVVRCVRCGDVTPSKE